MSRMPRGTTREEAEAFGRTLPLPSARAAKIAQDYEGSYALLPETAGVAAASMSTTFSTASSEAYAAAAAGAGTARSAAGAGGAGVAPVSPRALRQLSLQSHVTFDGHASEAPARKTAATAARPVANPVLRHAADLRKEQDATHFALAGPDGVFGGYAAPTSASYGAGQPVPAAAGPGSGVAYGDVARPSTAGAKRNATMFLNSGFSLGEMAMGGSDASGRRQYAAVESAAQVVPPTVARSRRADVLSSTFTLG